MSILSVYATLAPLRPFRAERFNDGSGIPRSRRLGGRRFSRADVSSGPRPRAQIPAQTLQAIKKELLRYDTVYSTNYDLLLNYWSRHAGWTYRIYGLLLWTETRPQPCGNPSIVLSIFSWHRGVEILLDRFAAEEVDQFNDEDDHYHQLQDEGAALVKLVDHEAVEIFSSLQFFFDQVFVVGDANFGGCQFV